MRFYCDYCDTFLTHDSPSVRKTHCGGRKHKDNVRMFYQKWLEEQVQKLVDTTTEQYKNAAKMAPPGSGPFPQSAMIPPPSTLGGPARPPLQHPPAGYGAPTRPPPMGMPPMMGPPPPGAVAPPMMGMRPPPHMMSGPPPHMAPHMRPH